MMNFYDHTNENIEGIVAGLDLCSNDTVLAVGGSGEQAFALLQFAGRVKVVDNNPDQTRFIKKRIEELQEENYSSFLHGSETVYFFTSNRLHLIQEKLANLTIAEPADIVEIAQKETEFSKLYLSNIIGFKEEEIDHDKVKIIFTKLADKLTVDGLIYVSNHDRLVGFYEYEAERGYRLSLRSKELHPEDINFLPSNLVLEKDLSLWARTHERFNWYPAVYRKIY